MSFACIWSRSQFFGTGVSVSNPNTQESSSSSGQRKLYLTSFKNINTTSKKQIQHGKMIYIYELKKQHFMSSHDAFRTLLKGSSHQVACN